MNKCAEWMIFAFAGITGTLFAQNSPKAKSQEEVQALEAIQKESGPEGRMAAVDRLLKRFPATEFKAWAISMAGVSLMETIDYDHMRDYAENTLRSDPENFQAMLVLSYNMAKHTSVFDPDVQEKLARIEKYAKDAIEFIKDAPKPNTEVPEQQWITARKDFTAQADETLRVVTQIRKNLKDIVMLEQDSSQVEGQLETAIDLAPNAATKSRGLLYLGRLAAAQANWAAASKHYESILALPAAPAGIKREAESNLKDLKSKIDSK